MGFFRSHKFLILKIALFAGAGLAILFFMISLWAADFQDKDWTLTRSDNFLYNQGQLLWREVKGSTAG